ncbi:5'-3' exonuclease PLD3-like, partial [Pyrgilauda ruficollis]|uniref:5'-3' exonuclease PLD3-like n=1 Tax=Pyrgilauda ruficollis TaxID=221976 RepID=UPI001B861654
IFAHFSPFSPHFPRSPSRPQGERILAELQRLPARGVAVRVAVSAPSPAAPLDDLRALERSGAAVRAVDLPRLTGGVLHTKFWLVDGVHLYIGSANMDWRALTQVKELGAAIYNCSCLAKDLGKIFEAYWSLGVPDASIPAPWPDNFSTSINLQTPLETTLNDTAAAVYFSVGVTAGLWGSPGVSGESPRGGDNPPCPQRLFLVPASAAQSRIPFARVSHTKYMVTDKAAYVGTSNWSGDYFERTAGSALVVAQPGPGAGTFRERLRDLFERDWSSRYSVDIGDTEGWAGRCGPR